MSGTLIETHHLPRPCFTPPFFLNCRPSFLGLPPMPISWPEPAPFLRCPFFTGTGSKLSADRRFSSSSSARTGLADGASPPNLPSLGRFEPTTA